MNAPANSNTLPPTAPAAAVVRQLDSDIRYQLRRAPFGLTLTDLRDHLNEDGTRQSSLLSVQMAVERLIEAGDAFMESRGELDYVVSATLAFRRAPPKNLVAHRDTARPLGLIGSPTPLPTALAKQLADPDLGVDRLTGGEGLFFGYLMGLASAGILVGSAILAGWL